MNRLIQSVLAALILTSTFSFAAQAKSYQKTPSVCSREPVACNIYFEARGEPLKGQYAVAYVTHNRLRDARFPKTLKGVVFQESQFSWTKRRMSITDQEAFQQARRIAAEVARKADDPIAYRQADPTKGSVYFNAKHVKTKHYKRNAKNVARIGNHVFFGKVVLAPKDRSNVSKFPA